jgi:cysteine desulfurase
VESEDVWKMKVYFDHSATTPVDPAVLEEMLPYFEVRFGNASSIHSFGREAKVALEEARERVAKVIGAEPSEIVFTSGGTEADNWAIKHLAFLPGQEKRHVVTSRVEHHAVLHACQFLEKLGFEVTYLKPDRYGRIEPAQVAEAIREDTALVSIMHANNEIGTINPVAEIGRIARERGVLFHTDAVQSYGKLPLDVRRDAIDLLSASSHKIYGPKGAGFLYIRKGVQLTPLLHGGGHERKRRAGTENVPAIVGFGKAAELCAKSMDSEAPRLRKLTERLVERVLETIPGVSLNGHPSERLPGLVNFAIEGVENESLLMSLDLKGIAASNGAACTSGSLEPSHVMQALGQRHAAVRFSLGRSNTEEEVDYVAESLAEIVFRLRGVKRRRVVV